MRRSPNWHSSHKVKRGSDHLLSFAINCSYRHRYLDPLMKNFIFLAFLEFLEKVHLSSASGQFINSRSIYFVDSFRVSWSSYVWPIDTVFPSLRNSRCLLISWGESSGEDWESPSPYSIEIIIFLLEVPMQLSEEVRDLLAVWRILAWLDSIASLLCVVEISY